MKFYVGVTDNQWFDVVSHIPGIDEVNFLQPSPDSQFQAPQRGNLFLFKLHRSEKTHKKDLIVGGGYADIWLPIQPAQRIQKLKIGNSFLCGYIEEE